MSCIYYHIISVETSEIESYGVRQKIIQTVKE